MHNQHGCNYQSPEVILRDFVSQRLSGDWSAFARFDFATLKDDSVFGSPDRKFDCDDTTLARAIYVLLWREVCPDLTMENLGTGRLYRGDTMNSFHTMFGRETSTGAYRCFERFNIEASLKEAIHFFHSRYHTIGNFVVLPNRIVNRKSLNCFRGCAPYFDYFDRYLKNIQACLEGKESRFSSLVQANDHLFGRYAGQHGFSEYCRDFHLLGYLDAEGNVKDSFQPIWYWKSGLTIEAFSKYACQYIETCVQIIDSRARELIGKLRSSEACV